MSARARTRRRIPALAATFVLAAASPAQEAPRSSQVGVSARISDLVLPGSELEVAPPQKDAPVVLRIVAVRPHGDAFRYDLEYWGLEPGERDLRDWLRRADGTSTADLPALPVAFTTALPEGRILPHAPQPAKLPRFGGYRTALIVGGVVWGIGLVALLVAGRKRRLADDAARPRVLTLAERLRPLVERASRGELGRAERAELELSLVAYWRKRLKLEERRPEPRASVDVSALLAPYRDLPADALGERARAVGA